MPLLIPRSAAAQILHENRRAALNTDLPEAKRFTKRLRKSLHERELVIGYVANANLPGLVNYCWHVQRGPGVPPVPLTGDDGERLPLDGSIVRQLEKWDLQSRAAVKPASDQKERSHLAEIAEHERIQEQKRDDLLIETRARSRSPVTGSDDEDASLRTRARHRRTKRGLRGAPD